MAWHVSGKLAALGVVITALITAFSAPREPAVAAVAEPAPVHLTLQPVAALRDQPVDADLRFTVSVGPEPTPRLVLRATGYNSVAGQTDATPYVTATGARTRFGVVAVSRDLLGGSLPYGSLVRLRDLGSYYTGRGAGAFQKLLDSQTLFIVEDTMHSRKSQQIDVWFPDYSTAISWGVRKVEVEVVRYGRFGPELDTAHAEDFEAVPQLVALR
jgi:3D (Asp-Asp-Asp) domain-containing protein